MAGSSATQIPQWPFAAATVEAPASAATYAITVSNRLTILKLTPTAAGTVNLTIGQGLPVGAILQIDVTQDATGRNITLGTGIVAPDLTGVADDRDTIMLIYNGTDFVGGTWDKVVNAA